MPVTLVMLDAIRAYYDKTGVRIGMKPAGGIRTAKQSLHYLVMVKETLGIDWLTPKLFRIWRIKFNQRRIKTTYSQHTGRYTATYDFSEA